MEPACSHLGLVQSKALDCQVPMPHWVQPCCTICNCLPLSATSAWHDMIQLMNFMNFEYLWRASRCDLHVWAIPVSLSPVLCKSWSFPPTSLAGLNNHGWKNWSHSTIWTVMNRHEPSWTSCQKSDHLALDVSTFQKPWSTSACGIQSNKRYKIPQNATSIQNVEKKRGTKDTNMLPWQSQIVTVGLQAVYCWTECRLRCAQPFQNHLG